MTTRAEGMNTMMESRAAEDSWKARPETQRDMAGLSPWDKARAWLGGPSTGDTGLAGWKQPVPTSVGLLSPNLWSPNLGGSPVPTPSLGRLSWRSCRGRQSTAQFHQLG